MSANVYSLGVVLYDMIFTAIGWGFPEDVIDDTSASIEVLALLNSMLDSDPNKRPTMQKVVQTNRLIIICKHLQHYMRLEFTEKICFSVPNVRQTTDVGIPVNKLLLI